MLRRLQLSTLLLVWLLATGSQWDVLQTFGWARMIARYAQTMSVAQAVRLTFTPENRCSLCDLVQQAKRAEQPPAATPGTSALDCKIVLFCPQAASALLCPSTALQWSRSDQPHPLPERNAPPVPPPRTLA